MTKKKKTKKMGRPQSKIDWSTVDKLAAIFCTHTEIAAVLGCHHDTLNNHCKRKHGITFSEYIDQKSLVGNISLRRKQYEKAMSGDKTMLVWLGKQKLGQKDKQEITNPDGKLHPPIIITLPDNGKSRNN